MFFKQSKGTTNIQLYCRLSATILGKTTICVPTTMFAAPWTSRKSAASPMPAKTIELSRIVVPSTVRRHILKLAHKGHPGIVRMKQKLRCSYWWPSMDAETECHVRFCTGCQASAKSPDKAIITADRSVPTLETPWTKLALDIIAPFCDAPTSQKYIFVAIDYTSKFAAIHSCTDISSYGVTKWLDELFCEYGLVSYIVTDNGRQFVSERFEKFLAAQDIQHIRTTPYHPESNGLVERFNRVLKTGVQAFTREGLPWNEGLRQLLINYRGNPTWRRQQVTRRTHVRPCLPATSSGCIAHHRKANNFLPSVYPLPYQPDRPLVLSRQHLNGEQRCSFATRVQHPAKARLRGASILTQFNIATTRHTLWCDPTAHQTHE